MTQIAVATPFNISLDFEVAPVMRRIFAWSLDLLVLVLYARGMKLFLNSLFSNGYYSIGVDILVVSMPMLLYHLLMEAGFQGQSLGKMAMGIRVISIQLGEPGFGQYLMRWIFRVWEWPIFFGYVAFESYGIYLQVLLSMFLGIGVIIIIAISPKSQRLGDLAAGTAVVDLRHRYSLSDTVFREVLNPSYQVRYPEVMRLSDRDINAIRQVALHARRRKKHETAERVAQKVREVLQIERAIEAVPFLEQLLDDYNYLAAQQKN